MPRFFFNLYDDFVSLDEEGRELASNGHALEAAIASARDMASAEALQGDLHLSHRIEVADSAGEVIHVVRFGDVVKVSE